MGVLQELREQMASAGVDALVIPTNDPHFCEVPPDFWARRQFISGFTGSAGTALVTMDTALLWTDARYYIQAAKELSDEWVLMKDGSEGVPKINAWISKNMSEGGKLGLDPYLFSYAASTAMSEAVSSKSIELVYLDKNPVDAVWGEGRPTLCQDPVRLHPLKYAGMTVEAKLQKTAETMKEEGMQAMILSKLDDIAWILNIRASDVPCTPLFVSYLIIREDATATLYCDGNRIPPEVGANLSMSMVTISSYEQAIEDVRIGAAKGDRYWLHPTTTSVSFYRAACSGDDESTKPLLKETPVPLMKAQKNEKEMEAMRTAYIKDGANWANFLCWLEDTIASGATPTEIEVVDQLEVIRRQQDGYIGPSFDTIAAAGENGAIIHYRPVAETAAAVTDDCMFLCDAGCQFEEGTTDITRTIHLSEPSDWQRKCFTKVLQGHIALDSLVFPKGKSGHVIDSFARRSLWSSGLDYRHGTGHGVGASLCVHEGPQGISFGPNHVPLEKGMVMSNEPGYYEPGGFGIRIESVIAVRESEVADGYFDFEQLTFVPIQRKLVDVTLMTESDCDWVDEYHSLILEKVSPLIDGKPLEWLRKATEPLVREGVASSRFKKRW